MSVSLQELGGLIRESRKDRKLSQEELSDQLGSAINRSTIAHLEQGLRLPPTHGALAEICEFLSVPKAYWQGFEDPSRRKRLAFEEALTELAGWPVSLRHIDGESEVVADRLVGQFFSTNRNQSQALDALNSILVFYGVSVMSDEFFIRYLGVESTKSVEVFLTGVRKFQMEAIRLFSNFEEAFQSMNVQGELARHLGPLEERNVNGYHSRSPWDAIEEVPEERLPDLGYISASAARKEKNEREHLASFLRELATKVAKDGRTAISEYSEKKRRKMSSLLRRFESRIEHDFMSPLFTPDPQALRREADLLAPKGDSDLDRIAATQAQAQRNLARYLAADHLDVYVATSMRTNADFVSVSRFARQLFQHADVKPLNLRACGLESRPIRVA